MKDDIEHIEYAFAFVENLPCCFIAAITHISLDWVSNNWYLMDDENEMIIVCTFEMQSCVVAIDVNVSKPRGIALDPTKG